jgi:hypothetical protein
MHPIMKTSSMSIIHTHSEPFMKKQAGLFKRIAMAVVMAFMVITSFSQTVAVNSVIVKPPYKARLDELTDQVIATVTSTQSTTVSMFISIKGDNGVSIRTNPSYLPGNIELNPRVPNQLTSSDIYEYFSASHLVSSGIPMRELAQSGLPEGNYQLCIRFRNNDGGYVSADEPMGCSNYFTIRYSDPPMPVNPQCGAVISNSPVQNIVFTWTPATGAPTFTNYKLRIVELLDSTQNPNSAMNSAKEPVFFETEVHGAFSFHYGPSQPLLEKGRIYAWQVIAEEEETRTKFANNGRSEVCWFKWAPLEFNFTPVQPQVKATGPKITKVTNVDPIPISVVTGNLNYKFKENMTVASLAKSTPSGAVININQNKYSDGLTYNQDNVSITNSLPLANVKVSLVISYIVKGTVDGKTYSNEAIDLSDFSVSPHSFLNDFPDQDKVIATTTTASDGSFTFTFMNTMKDLGMVDADMNWSHGGAEFHDDITGKFYKVLRLKVEDKYYCSPDINIKLNPWEALDLGTVVSYVKSYNLRVQTKTTNVKFYDVIGGSERPVDKVKTTLYRAWGVESVPANEAGTTPSANISFPRDLETSYSDENGYITFTNLVQHDPDKQSDRYWIHCEPDKNQGMYIFKDKKQSYYPYSTTDKKNFPFNDVSSQTVGSGGNALSVDQTYGQSITWNSQLKVKTYDMTVYLTPDNPRVTGKVETNDVKSKSMSNIKIVMLNTFNKPTELDKLILTATTDVNGEYEFNDLKPEIDEFQVDQTSQITGPKRLMFCVEPEGYNTHAIDLGILKYGQQVLNQDFILQPDGLFSGYVVDDAGNPVAASVQIDDLAFASTRMILEKDQQTTGNNAGNTTIHLPGNVINQPLPANQPATIHINTQNQAGTNQANVQLADVNHQPNVGLADHHQAQVVVTDHNAVDVSSVLGGTIKQYFGFAAPSGSNRKLIIQPKDEGYSTETFTVDVPKASKADEAGTKTYVVYKLKKRIRFRVVEKPAGLTQIRQELKIIPNATVTLQIPGMNQSQVTDPRGYVYFEFENNGSSFTFDIVPPEDADYEDATYTINNVEDTKSPVDYDPALVKKATRLTGKVYLGNEQTTLEGATVYIDKGNGDRIEANTGADGSYILKKVPLSADAITVWASKPNAVPNVSSQSKRVNLGQPNVLARSKTLSNDHTLDFILKADSSIAIADIYGFTVDVKNKKKQSDGTYLVSGSLISLPENANFKLAQSDQVIPFTDLKVKTNGSFVSGIPVGVPDADHFNTDLPALDLVLNGVFSVSQKPSSGQLLQISSENNKGQIKGKVGVSTTSFHYSDNYITFNETTPFYLTSQPGNSEANVVTLTVSDYPKTRFGVVSASGGDLQFKYLAFKAHADKAVSYIENDKVSLNTVLTTNEITGMTPSILNIRLGELALHPDKIDPVNGSSPLSFKLEKWDVEGSSWSIKQQNSGVTIPTGTIKTGLIDVPAKNMVITPDNFTVGEFQLQNMTFSGVIPLEIQDAYNSFGYNTSVGSDHKGHWELRIVGNNGNPAVTIHGLPGMESGASLKFQKFSLLSNGEQEVVTGNQQQELTFYNVLKVKPLSFSGGDKYFDMMCNIDLDIPRIEPASDILRFTKSTGQLKTVVYPFNVTFEGPGGIKFISSIAQGDQKVDATGYTAIGTIKDAEGINLKGILHRTTEKAWVEVNPTGQSMPLGTGQTSLANITGSMAVPQGAPDWTNFVFSGDMKGFVGMDNHVRKTFTVFGDIVANQDTLGVKNVPAPVSGMNVTYDIQNARLTADFEINQQIGAIHVQGTTNMVVDAAGWYMLTGGLLTSPGLGTLSAGMLIGDYHQMAPQVTQKLVEYSYNKNIPAGFQSGISGFLFVGQKTVPIINIPSFNLNLGVLSAGMGLEVGMDARLWMSFNGSGNEYGIGAMAFAHAWLSASSITCTKLRADARAEVGVQGVYQSNTGVFTATGCGSFSIGGSIEQCFPTPCWSDGICCEYCGGISVNQGIKVDILLDSNGNTSLDFGFGSCSGQ